MSSREPDNSQLRDPLLAKLMAASLASSSATPGTGCPDADTVAAYSEHNLSPEETTRLDVHFANCGHCQTVLAALARSLDSLPANDMADSRAELPWPTLATIPPQNVAPRTKSRTAEMVAARASAQPSKPASKIRTVIRAVPPPQPTRWRELAPALSIAAAIALWFALRPAPPTQNLSAQLRTDADTSETQLPTAPPPALSDPDIANPNIAGRNIPAADALTSGASQEYPLKKSAAAEEAANAPATAVDGTSAVSTNRKELQASEPAPAPSAPSASAPNNATGQTFSATLRAPLPAAPTKNGAPQVPESVVGGAAPAASIPPSTQRAKSAIAIDTLTSPATATVTGDLPIVSAQQLTTFGSPTGAVTWRIGARGSIERSTNRGQTWEKQFSGVFGDLTAGTAVSNDVAWIVGRAGIILRTTDGVHWQHVLLPARDEIIAASSPATNPAADSAGAAPSSSKSSGAVRPAAASSQASRSPLDLAAVTATDALHVMVISSAGGRFTTSDGGQTWASQ